MSSLNFCRLYHGTCFVRGFFTCRLLIVVVFAEDPADCVRRFFKCRLLIFVVFTEDQAVYADFYLSSLSCRCHLFTVDPAIYADLLNVVSELLSSLSRILFPKVTALLPWPTSPRVANCWAENTILNVVLTKDPVAEGDGHGVADQHLGGRHHSQVGDVHKHVADGHQGDCDA